MPAGGPAHLRRASARATCASALVAAVTAAWFAVPVAAEPALAPARSMPTLVGSPTESLASYDAISCPSTSSCTAVGPASAGFTATRVAPSAVSESAGTWGSPAAVPLPPGASTTGQPHLDDVSCSTESDCAAVGDYPIQGGVGAFATDEIGGTWSVASAIQLPAGGLTGSSQQATLTGVWCDPTGSCVAVGSYHTAKGALPMAVTETAGTWAPARRLPLFAGLPSPFGYAFTGLACTSVASCTVVGNYAYSGGDRIVPFADQETAGTWASPAFVPEPSLVFLTLNAVGCPSASRCLGVGRAYYAVRRGDVETGSSHAAYAVEDHGVWGTPVRLAEPDLSPLTDEAGLAAISCGSGGACEAVGDAVARHFLMYPLAISYGGGRWSSGVVQTATPLGASKRANFSGFAGVSCGGPTSCVGVGSASINPWTDPPYTYQPVFPFSTQLALTAPLSVPGAPIGVRVDSGVGAAGVFWQPPASDGGVEITGFTATAEPGGATCVTIGLSCAVHGLINDRVYSISVADRTSFATSASSAAVRVRIGVPTPPQGVGVATGEGFADVTWRASSTPSNEPVLAYDVTAFGHGAHLHCRTTSLVCRFRPGLVRHATYAVRVTATDKSGTSRPSARVIFTAS